MKTENVKNSIGNFLKGKGRELAKTDDGRKSLFLALERAGHFLVSLQVYNITTAEDKDQRLENDFKEHLISQLEKSIHASGKKHLTWFKEIIDGDIQVPDFLMSEVLKYATGFYQEILKKELKKKYKLEKREKIEAKN